MSLYSSLLSYLSNIDSESAALAVPVPSAVEAAAGAQAVNRSSVAALTFVVWDIFITLDQEVHLVWPKPWSYMKFFFFFVRYVPTLVQISILFIGTELTPHFHFTSHDCYIWQVYQGVAAFLIIVTVDFILILRVHALYNTGSAVRVIVGLCFGLEIIGMCVGLGLAIPGIRYNEICLVTAIPGTLLVNFGVSILFQTLLFGLTAYKFFTAVRAGWGEIPLIVLLMRDGTWAFAVLFLIMVADASLYGLDNTAYAGVLYAWLLSTFSFCGYRILLNINHLSQSTHRNTTTSPQTDPDLQFTTNIFSDNDPYSYELSPLSSTPGPTARQSAQTSTG